MQTDRLNQLLAFFRADSSDPFIIYGIGLEYVKLKQYSPALEQFELLLKNHPDYLATHYQYGKLLEALNRKEDAVIIYQRGVLIANNQLNTHAKAELHQAINEAQELDD